MLRFYDELYIYRLAFVVYIYLIWQALQGKNKKDMKKYFRFAHKLLN